MTFLSESMQAVVLIACERHASQVLAKLQGSSGGNWFAMPSLQGCRVGYWPHVSEAHSSGGGCAVFGFAEQLVLNEVLRGLAAFNDDGSLCPDCVAYEWGIRPSHIAEFSRDPVCGMAVNCDNSLVHNHDGEKFFFCSIGCRDAFEREPGRYVQRSNTGRETIPGKIGV